MNAPIVYEVDIARDSIRPSTRGASSRSSTAGRSSTAASFQMPEEGLDHAVAMPDVPGPDGLPDVREMPPEVFEKVPDKLRRFMMHVRPFEYRFVEPTQIAPPVVAEPRRHVWIKTIGPLPDNMDLHRNVLAYLSDYQLIATAFRPRRRLYGGQPSSRLSIRDVVPSAVPRRRWLLYAIEASARAAAASRSAGSSRATASSSRRPRRRAWFESGRIATSARPTALARSIGDSHG